MSNINIVPAIVSIIACWKYMKLIKLDSTDSTVYSIE